VSYASKAGWWEQWNKLSGNPIPSTIGVQQLNTIFASRQEFNDKIVKWEKTGQIDA
jgi:hypothetical protein